MAQSALSEYPVSKQWFRLLAERLDAVAVLYRVVSMISDADPHWKPVRVDHYRSGPYDMLLTLSGGRSIGLIRQGPTLPTANLRYRLRSVERLHSFETPFVTLVLTHADQATRRAIRSLGDPSEHRDEEVEAARKTLIAEARLWEATERRLAAWPLCTREHLAGLMGGVTLRRINQVLRPLRRHGLVREDDSLLMLTDEGLTYLARRDRAAVGLTLDRWSAERSYSNPDIYAGTALRALCSQSRHHAGVVGFAASLSSEVGRSPDHDLFDLLPTHRSTIGYRYDWTTYVIHPDASFTLEYKGQWRPFLLEFERRATTPKRISKRLESYRRYFLSSWAERDHGGRPPHVLFVFESPGSESAFLDIADTVKGVPIITSNTDTLAKHGILGDAWVLPPPHSLDRRPLSLTYRVAQ